MKIRIAKKKLRKEISKDKRFNSKKHIKLKRTRFAFSEGYGYRHPDDFLGLHVVSVRIRKKNKRETILSKTKLRQCLKDMFKADEMEHVPETETMEEACRQPPRTRRCRRTHIIDKYN